MPLVTPPERARTQTSVACMCGLNLRHVTALPGCGTTGSPVCPGNCDTSHGGKAFVTAPLVITIPAAGSVSSGTQLPPLQAESLVQGVPSAGPPTQRRRKTTSNTTGVPSSTALPWASTTLALKVVSNVPSLLFTAREFNDNRMRATGPADTATRGCFSTKATEAPSEIVSTQADTVTGPVCVPARSWTMANPPLSETANGASIGQRDCGSGATGVACVGGKMTAPGALSSATTLKYTRIPDSGCPLLSITRACTELKSTPPVPATWIRAGLADNCNEAGFPGGTLGSLPPGGILPCTTVIRVRPLTPPARAVTSKSCSTVPAGTRRIAVATPFSEPNGWVTSTKGLTCPTWVANKTLMPFIGWLSESNTEAFRFTVVSMALPTVLGSASSTTTATGRLLRPETTETPTSPFFSQAWADTCSVPMAVPAGMSRIDDAMPDWSVDRTSSRNAATRGCTSNRMFALATGRLSRLNATAVMRAEPPVWELTASVSV